MARSTKSAQPRRGASGRFVLRLTPGLHAAVRRAAADAGLSLNDYCVRRLSAPGSGSSAVDAGTASVVARAAELFGESLLAVIVYGSWVRDEAVASSDVDVLVVLAEGAPVSRELYRLWDARPLVLDGREVEPHFVNFAKEGKSTSGLWAEAAIDGIVLFERGLDVSRRLVAIRRDVVAGRLIRRTAHGQPYWMEVA